MTKDISCCNSGTIHDLTAEIVVAYVGSHVVPSATLPSLITDVYGALTGAANASSRATHAAGGPAVPIAQSVEHDCVVCLEDGLRFKSLKRHLATQHGMTVEQYRTKWDLPSDHPVTAPGYAKKRSMLAKKMGLGRLRSSRL